MAAIIVIMCALVVALWALRSWTRQPERQRLSEDAATALDRGLFYLIRDVARVPRPARGTPGDAVTRGTRLALVRRPNVHDDDAPTTEIVAYVVDAPRSDRVSS